MKYKGLIKQDIKDWDGTPFKAIVSDSEYTDLSIYAEDWCKGKDVDSIKFNTIVGYGNGKWITENGHYWSFAYPIDKNKHSSKRMTNIQLAKWLAMGNGQLKYMNGVNCYLSDGYPLGCDNEPVQDGILVRPWDTDKWIEPTTDLLKEGVK